MKMFRMFAFAICVFGVAGCGGGGGPDTADVSGTITLDGKPLAGADVHFIGENFAGYGKTNAEGKYELVQGALAGDNKVTISKIDESRIPGAGAVQFSDNPDDGMDAGQMEAMVDPAASAGGARRMNMTGETIPAHYSDPDKTQLMFVVPPGGTDSADFKLSSG